jgi:hypothetical protein
VILLLLMPILAFSPVKHGIRHGIYGNWRMQICETPR